MDSKGDVPDAWRAAAREEARAVYDELGAVDADGREWTLRGLMNKFNINRRTALQAIGLIAIGYAAPTAVLHAATGTASADATGEEGTQADPLEKVWVHEIESGDGASQINIPDTVSIDEATIDGNTALRFTALDETEPSFDTGITPNANRPTLVIVSARAETDGTTQGYVRLRIDQGADGAFEENHGVTMAPPSLSDGSQVNGTASAVIQAGGEYQINNVADPNNNNLILSVQELVL